MHRNNGHSPLLSVTFESLEPRLLLDGDATALALPPALTEVGWAVQDRLPGTVPNPAPQESDISTQVNDYRWIEDNADYDWWYGCAPTAIGMLTAYWDHWYKLSNVLGPNAAIFPGNSTGWLYDAYPSFSTDNFATPDYANGVVAGWSHAYQSLWDGENWIAPNWENHVPDSIADFIATDNGTTAYADIPGGLVKFMAWDDPRTPENESWSVQTKKDDYDSPTGVQLFLDRIDNGEPVILLMESYKDDGTGVPTVDQRHVALGVGGTDPDLLAYNDETVWLYTTWNSGLEEWEWATKYNDQGNLRDLDDWEGESHSGYEFFIVGGITMTPPTQSTSGLSGYFALAHENIGEIQSITIGLGDPDHPDWESGNQKTGVGANCVVTDIDLSAAEAYLHPGEQENWFLKVVTKTNATLTGQVMDFQIRYGGEMRWFTSDTDVTFGAGNNVAVAQIIIDANNGIFSPVSGTAWEDLDANGQMDADEPGLSGWEIHAYEDLNANGVQDPTEVEFDTTTDPDGIYTLSGLTRGYYVVAITPPAPGYVCTLPSGGTYTVKLSGNAIDGVDFGMVKSGQIQGTVQDDHGPLDAWAVSTFRDIDGDGQFNPLTEMSWEATTGIDGTYAFADLLPGDYVVSQVLLDGWAQTTPADGSYNIAVAADATVDGIDFDNVRLATIEGQVKYEIDTNGDGDTSDTDEKGTLEGWTVYLDADRDGQLDAGEVSTVTGVGGAYSFVGLAGGLYRANVIVPTTRGWVAVTPSSASRDVSVPAGQTVTAADFLVSYPYNPAKPNLVEDNNGFRKFTPALVYSPQGELSIFWDITNTGTIAASVFAVDFYVSADSVISPTDFFLGRVRISQTLAPGNYVDVNLQLTGVGGLPAIPAGEYYVGVIIDAANEIIESNEIDNMGVIKEGDTNFSQLEVRSRPDLQDRGDQWSTFPAGVTPGQMWNLQWDVLNAAMPDPTGAGQSNASNGFRVAFVASRDQTITVFDDLLGVVSVSSLDAGDWADVDLSLLAFPNIPAGDYYVGAIIDPYSEVAEADETNNIAISLDTVLTVLPTGTMSEGTVYLDANGNEQIDEGEGGLPGWRLRAFSDDNNNDQHDADEAIYTMQTDELGRYPLAALPAGTYLIELANPDTSMWRQVAPVDSSFIPTPQEVTITADKEVVGDINFGVVQFSKVGGTVWHDFNGDGTFNDGVLFNEDGLVSGLEWDVRFFRDLNDNGKLDTALGEVRQTTMSNNGAFTFSAVVPGNYVIEEVIQSGYLATTTANGVTGTTITSAELSDGVFFGNALPVTISGQKWYDLDADGIRDVGEPGLAGWTIYIDSNANGLFDPGEPSTVTDGADGGYIFNNLRPGRYITREVLQQGWIQSHPGTEYQYDQILTSGHTYIGVFGNYQYAEIRGLVFHDLDADGNQRPEEPGLGGWTVEAFRDDNLNGLRDDPNEVLIEVLTGYDIPATTDVNEAGRYTFTQLEPGTYVVSLVPSAGWIQSVPDPNRNGSYSFSIFAGGVSTNKIFGAYKPVEVSGYVFADPDGDGQTSPLEANDPLPGWFVYLDQDGDGQMDPGETRAETNNQGNYIFTGLKPSPYTVALAIPAGWVQTAPDSATYQLVLKSNDPPVVQRNFLAFKLGKINGYVWEDADGDRLWDPGEPALADWTVEAFEDLNGNGKFDPATETQLTAVTDAKGAYAFTGLLHGTYVVSEVLKDGWVSSPPIGVTYTVVIFSGYDVTARNFGNFRPGEITGIKWLDENADALLDEAEVGLAGWTITATNTATGGVISAVTWEDDPDTVDVDETGWYALTGLVPGEYVVAETAQAGWVQTVPAETIYMVVIVSGQVATGYDFGNIGTGTVSGALWNDVADLGLWDADELPMAGRTVKIFKDYNADGILSGVEEMASLRQTVTDENGRYEFADLAFGDYAIFQDIPAGYVQTYPTDTPNYAIQIGHATVLEDLDFGSAQGGVIEGNKWEDLNADGIWDQAEPPLQGWAITAFRDLDEDGLFDQDIETLLETVTIENGSYQFSALLPGSYVVAEIMPAVGNWQYSSPPDGKQTVAVEIAQTVQADFGNYRLGAISGQVWNDGDFDGQVGQSEEGLEGWTVTAQKVGDESNEVTSSSTDVPIEIPDEDFVESTLTVTGLSGLITDVNVTLDITHTEVSDLSIWLVSPSGTEVWLVNELPNAGENFTGTTFDDQADMWIGDGVAPYTGAYRPYDALASFDLEDPNGLWTLVIEDYYGGGVGTLNSWSISITTGELYEIISPSTDVPVGIPDEDFVESTLTVTGLSGHIIDANVTLDVTHTEVSDLSIWLVSPSGTEVRLVDGVPNGGENFTGTTFDDEADMWIDDGVAPYTGAYMPYADELALFDGEDPNGLWTLVIVDWYGGDVGTLNSWSISFTIIAEDGGVPTTWTTVTDENGQYGFADLQPGEYVITVESRDGWRHTQPDDATQDVTIISGYEPNDVNFGITTGAMVQGTVWYDANRDGVKDVDEEFLPDQTAYIDLNGDGQLDGNEPSGVSDVDGLYAIVALPPGTYTVRLAPADGWSQTFPADNGGYAIDLGIAQLEPNLDFGAQALPVPDEASFEINEDQTLNGELTASDPEDNELTFTVEQTPANGELLLESGGAFTYTPNENFNGTDTFTYAVSDGSGKTVATATITVNPVNDLPVIVLPEEPVAVNEDEQAIIPVVVSDVETQAENLIYTITFGPLHGTLTVGEDNALTYQPDADFSGEDSFAFTVTDTGDPAGDKAVSPPLTTDEKVVRIDVNPINDRPVAYGQDLEIFYEGVPYEIQLEEGTDVETPAGQLIYQLVPGSGPAHGVVVIDPATGVATYTAHPNYRGGDTDSFSFVVLDTGQPVGVDVQTSQPVKVNIYIPSFTYFDAKRPALREMFPGSKLILKVSMSGPGTAMAFFDDVDHKNISRIVMRGTTNKTRLTISGARNFYSTVEDIFVHGSLKSIKATKTDLTGDISVDGWVGSIAFDDVEGDNQHTLSIGGAGKPVSITFDDVKELGITAPVTAIKKLTVTQWQDDNGVIDTIQALSIRSLKAKKAKKPGAGDFAANLELTDASQKLTLGKASIAGNLTSGLWDVNGNIGSITVKGAAEGAAGLPGTVRADGNIKRITLGACRHFDFFAGGFNPGVNRRADGAGDFNVAAAATIKSVKIKGWKLPRAAGIPRFFQDSNFSAATIKKASVLNIEMGDGGGLYALKDLPGRRGLGITSVTYKDTDSGTKWRYPSKSFSAVPDFNIFEL